MHPGQIDEDESFESHSVNSHLVLPQQRPPRGQRDLVQMGCLVRLGSAKNEWIAIETCSRPLLLLWLLCSWFTCSWVARGAHLIVAFSGNSLHPHNPLLCCSIGSITLYPGLADSGASLAQYYFTYLPHKETTIPE